MAKSFPSGEDLGEASSPASTPYTLHPPLLKIALKAIFICISRKNSLPLHRKISAINDEQDYVKAGNYWRWLKKKLASQGLQPVNATHDFKFQFILSSL